MATLHQAIIDTYSVGAPEGEVYDPLYAALAVKLSTMFKGEFTIDNTIDPFDCDELDKFIAENKLELVSSEDYDLSKNYVGPKQWQSNSPQPTFHRIWASPASKYVIVQYYEYNAGYYVCCHFVGVADKLA